MANITFIIGNGFDVDLGLPSTYSHFSKSEEWANVLELTKPKRMYDEYCEHSLIQRLMMSVLMEPDWFDIEKEIDFFTLVSLNKC